MIEKELGKVGKPLSCLFKIKGSDEPLQVKAIREGGFVTINMAMPYSAPCFLHWGLAKRSGGQWTRAPKACIGEDTKVFDELAMRTSFTEGINSTCTLTIRIPEPVIWKSLEFILFYPGTGEYIKNGRYNYSFVLPAKDGEETISVEEAIKKEFPEAKEIKKYALDAGYDLAVSKYKSNDKIYIAMVADVDDELLLHWGAMGRFKGQWKLPLEEFWPEGTNAFDDRSVRTPFSIEGGIGKLLLEFPDDEELTPSGINFLIYEPSEDLWLKYNGNDLSVPLMQKTSKTPFTDESTVELAESIIGGEMGHSSWTLMHRFNLCNELISSHENDTQGLAIIFVWMRYSAIRQLDWQRHYNTQPRHLAHAQLSLVNKFAEIWRDNPATRRWSRMLMQTIGRGGDGGQGQRIRDEILNIMHGHNIKEVSGHFMEEWHQKLHNNTTPDDVVICKAYLAFMRSNGDLGAFYDTLEHEGVTRERLRSFDRPITTDPDFIADKKDAMIHSFENYLGILETVHGGAEVKVALQRARGRLGDLAGRIDSIGGGEWAVYDIVDIRQQLIDKVSGSNDTNEILDILYLDIALEDRMRREVEMLDLEAIDDIKMVDCVARNALQCGVSGKDLELALRQWNYLVSSMNDSKEWALEALACIERMGRCMQDESLAISSLVQPAAEYLGEECECEPWTIKLFAEETVRGSAAFPLAKIVHYLTPKLRKLAGLSGWQIIGPGEVSGEVVEIADLHSVQAVTYEKPTILLVERAGGDEEPPEGCVGIFTRVAPDLVSHLSVRARNLGILFVACFVDEEWDKLLALKDTVITANTTPGGEVKYEQGSLLEGSALVDNSFDASAVHARDFTSWAVGREDFTRDILGGKSNNLNLLYGKLPEWIKLPASMAVPFGGFEKVINDPLNSSILTKYKQLVKKAEIEPMTVLPKIREMLLSLNEPGHFCDEIKKVWKKSSLPHEDWGFTWMAIKKVWASKWNERAFLSRRHLGLPHDKLQMAVLVQQVVKADYAFVIHTVNPLNGNKDEVFAEVVLGLGETLVGNYPGRSLGFTYNRQTKEICIDSLPGKSVGLFGGGVIFRSDSNGEDLEGFAGAGLYDSYLAVEPEERVLDYTEERLLRDHNFRDEMLRKIGEIGVEVEALSGCPQDIEGAIEGDDYYVVQNRPQVGL